MDRDSRATASQVAASVLEQLTVLETSSCAARRSSKEAHPKAVLSTKHKHDAACNSPSDIAPVSASPHTLSAQVVSSAGCKVSKVSRQSSTPVDLPAPRPGTTQQASAYSEDKALLRPAASRPCSLTLARELSRDSSNSTSDAATPSNTLVSSYPPGPGACRLHSQEDHLTEFCVECRKRIHLCLVSYQLS